MTNTPTPTTYRIKGRWLLLARTVWVILALVAVTFFIAGFSRLYTSWRVPCIVTVLESQADCFKQDQMFDRYGLTRNFFAIFFSTGVTVEVLPWILAGVLVFWKKSNEPFGLLFSLMLVVAGCTGYLLIHQIFLRFLAEITSGDSPFPPRVALVCFLNTG